MEWIWFLIEKYILQVTNSLLQTRHQRGGSRRASMNANALLHDAAFAASALLQESSSHSIV